MQVLHEVQRCWLVTPFFARAGFETCLQGRPVELEEKDLVEDIKEPAEVFDQIKALLLTLLPRYEAQGKAYVHIAFGCTGGKHRSVFSAETMAKALTNEGYTPTVRHRNLSTRAADAVEGPDKGANERP